MSRVQSLWRNAVLLLIAALCAALLFGCVHEDNQVTRDQPSGSLDHSGSQEREPLEETSYAHLFGQPEPQEKKPYTILVCMNGSNLETDYEMATSDLIEMCNSGFDSDQINIIVLTGGTLEWRNPVIASDSTMVYSVSPEDIVELHDLGDIALLDSRLLAAFIDYGIETYPADRYGFLFWDHGGGPMVGYGYDERHGGKTMSMPELRDGLQNSLMASKPFEFIGFDCCLMGSLEIACVLAPYAGYMIASEDFEPGRGWNYDFLSQLSENPDMTGGELGKIIVDTYIEYYRRIGSRQTQTLSVIDLSKVAALSEKVQDFMARAEEDMLDGDFSTFSNARRESKAFGKSGETSQYDLVDLTHLIMNLAKEYSEESDALIQTVNDAVVYNGYGPGMEGSYGLSIYIPYDQKDSAAENIGIYQDLQIMPKTGQFLSTYVSRLLRSPVERSIQTIRPAVEKDEVFIRLEPSVLDEVADIYFTIWRQMEEGSDYFVKLGVDDLVEIDSDGFITTRFDGYWATLGGRAACMYLLDRTESTERYTTPAILNGEEVDIIVMFDEQTPDGAVLGAVPRGPEGLSAKHMVELVQGDILELRYDTQLFLEEGQEAPPNEEIRMWTTGAPFEVDEDFGFAVEPVGDELYLYGFWVVDIYNNSYYTDFIEIRY